MKADRIKKMVLVLLVSIAVYIWWGNFQLLAPTSTSTPEKSTQAPVASVPLAGNLTYSPPKVNPFLMRPDEPELEVAAEPPPAPPEPLNGRWQLVGVVRGKKAVSAILKDQQGQTVVCSIGDSLNTWIISSIKDSYAIVSQDNWRDTLWLRGTER